MNTTKISEADSGSSDDLLPEYRFDRARARPNRFADRAGAKGSLIVQDEDVAEVFTISESVNVVLRALIAVMPADTGRPRADRD